MNITITITNPTVNVLAALAGAHAADNAKMMESLDKASTALDVLLDEIARQPSPSRLPQPSTTRCRTHLSSRRKPTPRTPRCVSPAWRTSTTTWTSALKSTGTARSTCSTAWWKINDEMLEDIDDVQDTDEKIVFIRRNDTDKLVSLTLRDLQTGRLTLID